jgi:hypothetical protein
MYSNDNMFRSRIEMQKYRFGEGEYKYFADPLPPLIESFRVAAYSRLVPIANTWMEQLGTEERYPFDLHKFLHLCAEHGQTRPTPLLLQYRQGGYNCLHQDIYGEVGFPLQMTAMLSPKSDYTGGEFLLVEQRLRSQSRGEAVSLEQGETIIFANRYRPLKSSRGYYRAGVRHGVSRLLSGSRHTLGLIFHNAR